MRGGYRQGAGRKKGFAAKSAEESRRFIAAMVSKELESIGRALIKKAKKGDIPAIRELFDRAWGKTPQTEKIQHGGVPFTPRVFVYENEHLYKVMEKRGLLNKYDVTRIPSPTKV